MFYLIQDSKEERYQILLDTLDRLKMEYEVCKYRPFLHEIEFKTDRKDIWCFGAYDLTGLSEKYGFKPGQMANDNHNFEVYGPKYGEHMLNSDYIIMDFSTPLPEDDKWDIFFARPTKDTKVFAGQIFNRVSWNEYVHICQKNDTIKIIEDETKIVISSPKNILQEIRCWVVGGKVITISQYKVGRRVTAKNLDDDTEAFNFAQEMVDIYQPAQSFVIDICRTSEGFKVIEINCINASGFYHMDCDKLLMALENEFN